MNGKYLLDTNIVIRLFARDKNVINWLKKGKSVFLPCITLGELLYGAEKSANVEYNKNEILELSSRVSVLPCDEETAKHYGVIKKDLKNKGKPIPENDIWISCIARQHNLTVVTSDKHFKEIEDIMVEYIE